LQVKPTTIYLLTHHQDRCLANCLFCPQARTSQSRLDLLSRVNWPVFSLEDIIEALVRCKESVRRVCLQAVNYTNVTEDLLTIVSQIFAKTQIDVSVSCQPLDSRTLKKLYRVGVDRISIPLDAATPQLFDRVKGPATGGPYTWQSHMKALREALSVFGAGRVTTHLIVGLGETDQEILGLIQELVDLSIYPALFAFTSIRGTRLENQRSPSLSRYRLIQTARFLLLKKIGRLEDMKFDSSGNLVDFGITGIELQQVVESGLPYLTSGCPNCNRPFYNEKVTGPIYNYPRPMTHPEIEETKRILEAHLSG
jgi:biotin synthase-related radical SAM superfamily protein